MKKYYSRLRKKIKEIFAEKKSPHQLAMGIALGVGFGMGPTPGLQMFPAMVIAARKGYSVLAASFFVFVNNPVTIIPIYIMNTWIGYTVVNWFTTVSWEEMKRNAENIRLDNILELGGNFLLAFIIGGIVVGIVSGVFSYYVSLVIIEYKTKAKKNR